MNFIFKNIPLVETVRWRAVLRGLRVPFRPREGTSRSDSGGRISDNKGTGSEGSLRGLGRLHCWHLERGRACLSFKKFGEKFFAQSAFVYISHNYIEFICKRLLKNCKYIGTPIVFQCIFCSYLSNVSPVLHLSCQCNRWRSVWWVLDRKK